MVIIYLQISKYIRNQIKLSPSGSHPSLQPSQHMSLSKSLAACAPAPSLFLPQKPVRQGTTLCLQPGQPFKVKR